MSDQVTDTTTATAGEPSHRAPRRGPGPARLGKWLALAALVVVLLAIPFYASGAWLRAGEYVMIGVVGAIGLTLLIGQAGQLSLGHAFFLFVGAVSYTVLTAPTDSGPVVTGQPELGLLVGFGLPPIVGLIGAFVIPALVGIAFAPVAGRVRGIYLAVATLALVFIGIYLGRELAQFSGGTGSGRPAPDFAIFGFSFGSGPPEDLVILSVPFGQAERQWYLFLALCVLGYVLAQGAVRGRPGRAWRAVRDNEAVATAMGVWPARARAEAFAISSGYAGLAGAMTVLWFGILKANENEIGAYGINIAIAFLAMVLVGGLGSIPGAVCGALLVFGLQKVLELSTAGTDIFGPSFTPVIVTQFVYGAAIVLVVLFEPGGLAAIGRRLTATLARIRQQPSTKGS